MASREGEAGGDGDAKCCGKAKRADIADKGYSSPSCRKVLRKLGITHTIPERRDQRDQRTGHPGRKRGFDANVYWRRNVVERCVNRLKQWRGIATRYEKRAVNYRAMVVIAALMVWLAT